jgi:cell division protease FtsH
MGHEESEIRRIAYHEAGHVVAGWAMGHGKRINTAVIVPDRSSLGMVSYRPRTWLSSRAQLDEKLMIGLAGRAAEEAVYGPEHVSNLCGGDLSIATRLGLDMVGVWGMGRRTGLFSHGMNDAAANEAVRSEVSALLDAAYGRALMLVTNHRQSLDLLASLLVARRRLTGDEVLDALGEPPALK